MSLWGKAVQRREMGPTTNTKYGPNLVCFVRVTQLALFDFSQLLVMVRNGVFFLLLLLSWSWWEECSRSWRADPIVVAL